MSSSGSAGAAVGVAAISSSLPACSALSSVGYCAECRGRMPVVGGHAPAGLSLVLVTGEFHGVLSVVG
jgi:hypothetical protein